MTEERTKNLQNAILRWTALLFFIFMMIVVSAYFANALLDIIPDMGWNDYPGAVAIAYVTFSASVSLMLVLLLNYTIGPIEFSGLGFTFKGGSGPVVLWMMCFLAIMISFSLIYEAP